MKMWSKEGKCYQWNILITDPLLFLEPLPFAHLLYVSLINVNFERWSNFEETTKEIVAADSSN